MAPVNWAIPASVAAIAAVWLVSSKAEAATPSSGGGGSTPVPSPTTSGSVVPGGPLWSSYSASQQAWIKAILAEAKKQGVPVELALATGEVESNFRNVTTGPSYGPMQVHTSALVSGETVADLQNSAFSIARGVTILRRYLVKAKGNSTTCRLYYFCGPAYDDDSCKPATRAVTLSRWATYSKKWNVKATYTV